MNFMCFNSINNRVTNDTLWVRKTDIPSACTNKGKDTAGNYACTEGSRLQRLCEQLLAYRVRLFSSILLIMGSLGLRSHMFLPSCPPAVTWIASKTKTYIPKALKVKLTLITADAGNVLNCSVYIPGTYKTSLHSHFQILGK
jgi:hypothetical protein